VALDHGGIARSRGLAFVSRMRQILLLRGINLGSRNRVAMPALREALAANGMDDVRSYLQSGNVVVSSEAAPEELARRCEATVAASFGLEVAVLTRTRDELAQIVSRDPLGDVASDPKRYQVSFLAAELDADSVRALSEHASEEERLVAVGRELYAWHPHGVARSKLWARLAGRELGVAATARNWSTVTALLAMADG
jgi:uncharacterized protein (DUF1697 family)